jgi:DNA-binding CsgD family transcriptional regulator
MREEIAVGLAGLLPCIMVCFGRRALSLRKKKRATMKPLSDRELSCLQWVAAGKTSWETSRILGLSERTINFHVRNACGKLGVNRRSAAVATALRGGLLKNL